MENKIISVAGYIRVSTAGQVKEGESLKVQEEAIKKYASAFGFILVEIVRDEGISGAKDNRPGLNKLLEMARAGKVQKVIFKKLSRFGRNTRDLLDLYKKFEEDYKVSLVSLDEGLDTSTAHGRFLRDVLAAAVTFERETIKGQLQEAKFRKLKRNETFVGKMPYGYRFDKEKKYTIAIPEEQNTYLEIVDMFLNRNLSLRNIALDLKRGGEKSPTGKYWNTVSLSYILKNPAYKGKSIVNRHEYYMDGANSRRKYEKTRDGKRVQKFKPESEWIDFHFPKFIEEAKWNDIQRKIEFNVKKPKNVKYPDEFLAHGVIYCGICGGRVTNKNGIKRRDGIAPHYYRCYWATAGDKELSFTGKEKCTLPSVRMEEVDKFLWGKIVNILTYPKSNLKRFLSDPAKSEEELLEEKKRAEGKIDTNKKRIRKYVRELGNFTQDEYASDEIRAAIKNEQAEVKDLEDLRILIEKQLATLHANQDMLDAVDFPRHRTELLQCLNKLPGREKKHIIRILISPENNGRVTLYPRTFADIHAGADIFDGSDNPVGEIEGQPPVAQLEFNVRMDKIIGAINYLKNKGLLSIKLDKNGSDGPSGHDL